MPDTLSTLTVEQKQYYERQLLYRARAVQLFYKAGKKQTLPANSGNTISYRRFNALPLATATITEGVPPPPSALSISEIVTQVQQYGNHIQLTDMVDLLAIDKVMREAMDVLGQNAGESAEAIIRDTLKAGSTVQYGGTATSRSGLVATDVLTYDLFRKARRQLDVNNALPVMGGGKEDRIGGNNYIAFIHPNQEYDLMRDAEIKTLMQNNANNDIFKTGYVGTLNNIDVYKTTLAPVFVGAGSGGVDVYAMIVLAKDAFGVVDVAGRGEYQMRTEDFGSGGATGDPLGQIASVGWKALQAPLILNNNFMVRVETGGTFNL